MLSFTLAVFLETIETRDQYEQYWLPTPKSPGDEAASHTSTQKRILRELRNLQEAKKLNPQDDIESRQKLLSNFDWKDSMLQQHET